MIDAEFSKEGDPRYFWTERVSALDEEIALTWYGIGEPLLIHTQPNAEPNRPYGVCTVLIPALGARLTRNGVQAVDRPGRASAKDGPSAPARWRSPKAGPRRADQAVSGTSAGTRIAASMSVSAKSAPFEQQRQVPHLRQRVIGEHVAEVQRGGMSAALAERDEGRIGGVDVCQSRRRDFDMHLR